MAITLRTTDIFPNGSLVSVNNIVPLTVSVASSYNTTVKAAIYRCSDVAGISSNNKIADNLEMLLTNKRTTTATYYIEIGKILRSAFRFDISDELQAAGEWIDIDDILEDFVVEFTASNSSETTVTKYVCFTAYYRSRQFGQDMVMCVPQECDATSADIISTADRKLNPDDTIYCQAGNVVYIYAITSDDAAIVTESMTGERYFVDSLDGAYVTDDDNDFFTENLE